MYQFREAAAAVECIDGSIENIPPPPFFFSEYRRDLDSIERKRYSNVLVVADMSRKQAVTSLADDDVYPSLLPSSLQSTGNHPPNKSTTALCERDHSRFRCRSAGSVADKI
jgi:hypothetical protein